MEDAVETEVPYWKNYKVMTTKDGQGKRQILCIKLGFKIVFEN